MKPFEYRAPRSLDEVVELLGARREQARVLAGGTDVYPRMEQGVMRPELLVDLKRVQGLASVAVDDGQGARIGALALMAELVDSRELRARYPALIEGARWVGSLQIRNRATLGGNLCNASPAADTAIPVLALGALLRTRGPRGERTIPVDSFFQGPGRAALEPDEVLTEVILPALPPRSGQAFERLTRTAMDIAVVSCSAVVSLDPRGRCLGARLALGAVAPVPLRATAAEQLLQGERLTPAAIRAAAAQARAEARPITDVRASAEYRREMVEVLARRVLQAAADQVEQG